MRIKRQKNKSLDKIDKIILDKLQNNAHIPIKDLAEMVGLSYAPCAERINRLEEMQVIKGYRAHLNANLLDASLLVFIEISFDSKTDQNFEQFKESIQNMVHILECYLITGEFDFLLKVRIKDITEYRKMLTLLLSLPNIVRSRSAVVMEEIKETTALPINFDMEEHLT